jgi:hypothetical protein
VARQAGSFVENSFVKGLITEATGLNFPEQAVTETDNCVFDDQGIVKRRLGIDLEHGYEISTSTRADGALSVYRWDAAAGNGDNTIVIAQVGSILFFYSVDSTGAISDTQFASIELDDYKPTGTNLSVSSAECQYAAGNGFLFVANPAMETVYITYDPDAITVSATVIDLKTRDFEGIDDGLEITERPTVLSEQHEYNLLNQGWDTDVQQENSATFSDDYILDGWEDARADYPSNADTWFIYFPDFHYDFSALPGVQGNTPSPKGHYILDYHDPDRNSVSIVNPGRSITGLTGDDAGRSAGFYRMSTVEFFAGRVWYAGTQGEKFSNQILFSQIIERNDQISECYQANDPASSTQFSLLASDGGVVLIPDSGTVVKLFAFQDALLVFATNGVWSISGSEGVGFRATDYSVIKVSNVGCLSPSSFVSIDGLPSFWNGESIYFVNQEQTSSVPSVTPLTDSTIRSFYNDIPYESKRFAKGAYNRRNRIVSWLYRSTDAASNTESYEYDRVLNFNLIAKSFYGWSIDTSTYALNAIISVISEDTEGEAQIVTDSALATVTNSALATVYAFDPLVPKAEVFKFLVSTPNGGEHDFTFAEEWNTAYVDWYSVDEVGLDYDSYFTTGYKVHGDGYRKVTPTYINLFFSTENEASTLDFQSRWQYALSGSTGRWSSTQRITTDSGSYSYERKRIKSRGSGIVYQFRVDSVAGQPFNLIGWSVFETSNQGV